MGSNAPADRLAANLAARRHNVLTAQRLHDAGLNRRAIAHRVARGWLTRLHRGVYLLGPQPATWTPEAAALAACGPAGVLSHTSAAAPWGIHAHSDQPVHVTLRHGDRRPKGIHIHRSPLAPRDATHRENLRLTTPDRTLLDLAATLPRHDLELALNEALVAHRTTIPTLLEYLTRPDTTTRPGVGTLRAILHHDHGITRSEAERRLQDLIARAGIPRPHTNVHLAGWEIDCYWPDLAVAVELDSLTAQRRRHPTPAHHPLGDQAHTRSHGRAPRTRHHSTLEVVVGHLRGLPRHGASLSTKLQKRPRPGPARYTRSQACCASSCRNDPN